MVDEREDEVGAVGHVSVGERVGDEDRVADLKLADVGVRAVARRVLRRSALGGDVVAAGKPNRDCGGKGYGRDGADLHVWSLQVRTVRLSPHEFTGCGKPI
ncbi:hypothetical protein ACFPRL_26305 [Pseudoclavibacter helvolus]